MKEDHSGLTPVEIHGKLSVRDGRLTDEQGRAVQLFGMSTHGIAWFPQYICGETFRTIRDDWGTNCIRIALYTHEYHGYCTDGDREELLCLVRRAIGLADELGMYIILDWHVLNEESPMVYLEQAKAFFSGMSQELSDHKNVIYEICNEPNRNGTWDEVRSYAEQIIPVLRESTDAVILVGTPVWSQRLDEALAAPLKFDNIMYSLHFYADTHREELREMAGRCIEAGLPVFVSEFNITDFSGIGNVNFPEGEKWMEFIRKYGLSHICWSLSDHMGESSVIRNGVEKLSGWDENELSQVGRWIRAHFRQLNEEGVI